MITYSSNMVPVGQRALLETLRYYVQLEKQRFKHAAPHPDYLYGLELIAFLRTLDLSIRAEPEGQAQGLDPQSVRAPFSLPEHLQYEKLTLGDPLIFRIFQAIHNLQTDMFQAAEPLWEISCLLEEVLSVSSGQGEPPPRASLFRRIHLNARELLLVDTFALLHINACIRDHFHLLGTDAAYLQPYWQALTGRWAGHLINLPVSDLSTCSSALRRQFLKLERQVKAEQQPSVQIIAEAVTINTGQEGDDPFEEIHTRLLLRFIERAGELTSTPVTAESSLPEEQLSETASGRRDARKPKER